MWFKDISYQQLWRPFCSAEQTNLCNFGRGHYEKHFFSEIILNFGQWLRRKCCLNIFLMYSSGGHFAQQSKTICAIFERWHNREQFCEVFSFWTRGSGGDVI